MRAGWETPQNQFRAVLKDFHDRVSRLAYEMFEIDQEGELPIYVRITDRTIFKGKDEGEPMDIGMKMAFHRLVESIGEEKAS